MTITITDKEFDAINAVLDQVVSDYEAATNEEYIAETSANIDLVQNVLDKYRKAKCKARDFQSVRAYVAEKQRGKLRPRDIDKLARKLQKKIQEESK